MSDANESLVHLRQDPLLRSIEEQRVQRAERVCQVMVVSGVVAVAFTNTQVIFFDPGWWSLHAVQQFVLVLMTLGFLVIGPILGMMRRWGDAVVVGLGTGSLVMMVSFGMKGIGLEGLLVDQGLRLELGLVAVLVATALLDPARQRLLVGFAALPMIGSAAHRFVLWDPKDAVPLAFTDLLLYAVGVGAWWYTQSLQSDERRRIHAHLGVLQRVRAVAARVGDGDLRPPQEQVPDSVRGMVSGLSEVLFDVRRLASSVAAATEELSAMAVRQAGGAAEQASAIAETRATVSDVAREAADIEGAAGRSEASAREAADRSAALAEVLDSLFATTARVEGLLKAVRRIADRSDLLALNASLEGVRAGSAGRGFLIVAEEMQGLSAQVRQTVQELQQLNGSIRETSEEARQALEGSVGAVRTATQAVAEIRSRTARQDMSMRQVERSVAEIAEVTHRVAAGTEQLQSAVGKLRDDMGHLEQRTARFQLEDES